MCWFFKFTNFPMVFLVYDLNLVAQRAVISLLSPYLVLHAWFFHFPMCYNLLVFLKPHLKWVAYFSFIFPSATARDNVHTVFSHVLFYGGVLLGRDICEMLSSFWRLSWCYMDCISFVFSLITPTHKAGKLFSECCSPPSLISAYPSFLELLPCTQGSCYIVGYYLYWPMSLGRYLWLLLNVVSSGWSLSLCCMDGGNWNWGTAWWMLVYDMRMFRTLALFEILEHPGMGVCCYFLSPLWTVSKVLLSLHGPVESEHLPGVARVWRKKEKNIQW